MSSEEIEQPRKNKASAASSNGILKNNSRISNSSMAGRGTVAVSIGTKPTLIEKAPMRFLIMDAPRNNNLHVYIKEMGKHHVTEVVRVCEPTYRVEELSDAGIGLHEMEYKDGTSPPKELILAWLQLVEKTFYQGGTAAEGISIAVHCVAGLGRAPVMVAIALIEFADMDPVDAVTLIRSQRRGAINEKQLLYIEGYKKQYRRIGGGEASCCVIL
jgi:protein tyrosine phosphatase type 4A